MIDRIKAFFGFASKQEKEKERIEALINKTIIEANKRLAEEARKREDV